MDETKIVVTDRPSAPEDKSVLVTPPSIPDVKVVSIPAWKLALIRAARTYGMGVAATWPLLGTGGPQAAARQTLQWLEFPTVERQVYLILVALFVMPLGTALASFGWNVLEYFKQWDKKFPEMRA